MPIFSTQDIVSITDVQNIYLDALKRFPVMHLSPSERIIDGGGYVLSKQINGKLMLKPNITKQGLLFRGASNVNKVYTTSTGRRFNRFGVNFKQFESLINSFPLYDMFKNGVELPNGETLCLENPYGLAYIYDISLPYIGLTSDLNVAMFYAVTSFNEDTCRFEMKKEGTGVLYAYELRQPLRLTRSLTTIGLQVFPRSFGQRLFLLQMPENADFNQHKAVIGFRFNHQEDKAKEIFEMFKGGEMLEPSDDFLCKKLKQLNDNPTPLPVFEAKDLETLYERIDDYWAEFISLIHFEKNEEEIKRFLLKLPQDDKYARYFNLNQYYNER